MGCKAGTVVLPLCPVGPAANAAGAKEVAFLSSVIVFLFLLFLLGRLFILLHLDQNHRSGGRGCDLTEWEHPGRGLYLKESSPSPPLRGVTRLAGWTTVQPAGWGSLHQGQRALVFRL